MPLGFGARVGLLGGRRSEGQPANEARASGSLQDAMEEAWDEATEETEDDVMALTLSFLVSQWPWQT